MGSINESHEMTSLRILTQGLAAEIRASIAIELNGKAYGVIHDHNGCITCLVDMTDGKPSYHARYGAFGEIAFATATLALPWGFSSKRYDTESGFIYFGKRYYNPEDGRWITKDPLGDCDGPNLYAYVKNQPLTLFDAYGLFASNFFDIDFNDIYTNSMYDPFQDPPELQYWYLEKHIDKLCKNLVN